MEDNKTKNIMELAGFTIEKIKEKGADEGRVFVTEGRKTKFVLKNGEYNMCSTDFSEDINVLVYKDKKKGEYFINKANEEAAELAADMAATSAETASEDEANIMAPDQGEISAQKGVYTPDMDKLFERMEELRSDIENRYPLISINEIEAVHGSRHMVYKNTSGTVCDEYTGSYYIGVEMAGHDGDKTTSLNGAGVTMDNLDRPVIECGDIDYTLKMMEKQLDAKPMEGKYTGTVMMCPGCAEQFLSYLLSCTSGAGVIIDGTGIWLDKIGEQVTDSRLSVRFDPHDERIVCGETLTYDGFKAEAYDWIKDGVLKNFRLDYYSALKTGKEMASNDSFNIIVEGGDTSYDDMIKHIENGIIIDGFSGGMPAADGNFSGVAKNGFLIKNGEIAGAVNEVMISGNLAEMFMNIKDISKETVEYGNSAGRFISFDGITVSGKE